MRYFIYNGLSDSNLFGLRLEVGKLYHYDTLLPETNEKLGGVIDWWLTTGREANDFIEIPNINDSVGNIILVLNQLCDKLGLEATVTINIKK
jgi:hypothetical protein